MSEPASKSYLARLRFTPDLARGFVASYIANIRLVFLLMMTIALLGILAYTQLPRRLNPEVKIPIVTIMTVLPGAGPSDVESLVTVPIEDKLRSLKGIDTLTSSSVENVSVIAIQFLSSVDRDKAKDDVQSAVDGVNDLPSDAQTPKVAALDFEDQPVWTFTLATNKQYPDLMRTTGALKKTIEDLSKVDRVTTTGFDTQEVVITANSAKMAEYNLNPIMLSSLIKKARGSYPAGTVTTGRNSFAVTIDTQVESVNDIRNLKLSINGAVVPLSALASVEERSKPNQQLSLIATPNDDPRSGVVFYVYKTTGTNIDEAGRQVEEAVTSFMNEKGEGYEIITLSNTSEEITKQFSDLLGEFRTTIILVMVVLLLFLGLRQSLISSLTVPLTFLSAFFFMQVTGMSINFLSLFSFLLALGLLVDDTIVTVSAMSMYYRSGKFTPLQTGLLVWKDTIIPIWSTTITTIWSFVPLLITSGIIGEFIKPIPIVVTVTMLSSTAIAVLITLPLMIVLLKPHIPSRVVVLGKILIWVVGLAVLGALVFQSPVFPLVIITYIVLTIIVRVLGKKLRIPLRIPKSAKRILPLFTRIMNNGIIDVEPFAAWYKRLMMKILKDKGSRQSIVFAVVGYSLFCFALLPLGYVKNEFFPKSDTDEFFVQLELPAGTTIDRTLVEGKNLLEELRQTPELEYVTAEIGRGASDGFTAGADSANVAYFSLRLTEHEKRSVPSYTIAEDLRTQLRGYQGGTISVIEQSGGPPAGSDLQIKLLGDDLTTLDQYADKIATFLRSQPGVTNVKLSVKEGTSKLVFVPDSGALASRGIGSDQLALSLRTMASGFTLDSLSLEEGATEKTDVSLRMQPGTASVEELSSLMVPDSRGGSVPLASLGSFVSKVNPTNISRENFQRTISVSAAVRPGFAIPEENKKLEAFAKELKLPDGYEWKTGGVNDENAKSIQSILRAMILSAVLILITMVLQFGSFRQALIVLIVIPLAVSSVFLAFAITGTPLSFPALIGVLSLFGIVVTNSMFIVDKINLNRKQGMEFTEAIADAGASRMEPIILTKLCTVFGLLPITIADPLWRGLGGAIISGLLIASTIMLLFIPVLYQAWMKDEK